jgi:phage-related protein
MRDVVLYRTRSGRCPVTEFLDSLTAKQADKVVWVLGIVLTHERLPANYFKKLADTEGLWEVRVQYAGDEFRLIGFFDEGRVIVLVSGFVKKTEKTPVLEIELAHQRQRDYLSRKDDHG